mmetsp:Transcript_61869/g.108729  ORF Transcript_61869/g.108729 Transcript_61869/m.108729 type:complete len:241 (+) Transcript_61869:86-808(+)
MWRSTMSPIFSESAARSRSAYCSALTWWPERTMFAPGWRSGPLSTSFRIRSMLYWLTISGYVITLATSSGTPTWCTCRFGSGEMTVRPEKSTRFPDKLPRKRPCLPFKRWHSPRIALVPIICLGMPGVSPLMNKATWICRYSQSSATIFIVAPFSSAIFKALFISMISCSFTVKSSSVLPPPMSCGTLGRIGTGGTGTANMISPSGRPYVPCIHNKVKSSSVIRFISSYERTGVSSSTDF